MKEIVNDGFAKVVKPYIDAQDKKIREIIAPVEVSPAEAPHSVGDQIIYNGLLYDVTAPIEVEDSLETSGAGANISAADNIEAQIKATKSQIQAAAAQAAAQNKKTQKMLAPVEEDETDASRAYVIGEQLILDGILYNVIDPIAQHGIITAEGAGANIEEADDVTTQLSSLDQTLANNVSDINTALGNEVVTRAKVSGHNLLNLKPLGSRTQNGVTFVTNADGSVTVSTDENGATGNAAHWLDFTFEDGEKYKLSGCPSGGSSNTFYLVVASYGLDTGDGYEFTANSTTGLTKSTGIYVKSGTVINPAKTFYPMIRLASDANSDYEPYAMTNREMTPYIQAISNPNLLDNPWFTVNQRGVTSLSAENYGVDRWRGVYDIDANGNVDLSATHYIIQKFESELKNFLDGKTITASILFSDGTIESGTGVYNKAPSSFYTIVDSTHLVCQINTNGDFTITAKATISSDDIFRAVKLELGSVSTLARDTAPNYATELLKCQRYFVDMGGVQVLFASSEQGTRAFSSPIRWPVTMRANPSINVYEEDSYAAIIQNIKAYNLTQFGSTFDFSSINTQGCYCTRKANVADTDMLGKQLGIIHLVASADL